MPEKRSSARPAPRFKLRSKPGDWRNHAACATADAEAFFPISEFDTKQIDAAREMCFRCPVRLACLEYALTRDVEGIWGATTRDERERLRREGGINIPTPHEAA